ncbi:hypothetical protein ACFLUG_03270 [Chloroflexota bacterium]
MARFTLLAGLIPICLGIWLFGTAQLVWAPLFLLALGISVMTLRKPGRVTIGFFVVTVILYVVVYLTEPQWLMPLIDRLT